VSLHPILAQVFRRWNESNVAWALLRVPENLDAPEGDIDILLEPAAAKQAYELAQSLRFVSVPGYAPDTHLARFDRGTRRWLWLHCTTELTFGPYGAVRAGAEVCLAGRFVEGLLTRVTPNHEFWVTLMHSLLDKRRFSDASKRRIQLTSDAACPDGSLPDALSTVLPPGWTPRRVMERAQERDWAPLLQIAPEVWGRALDLGRPPLVRRAARAAMRLLQHTPSARRHRGLSVALIGPDGAGKSTLATGLKTEFVFPVRQMYMGLTGGWLRHVDRLRLPGVVRLGRLSVIWSRYLRGRYYVLRGELVVFDRYIYDAVVPPPYPIGRLRRLGRWVDGHSCPAPDLVLILDAPGNVMHARKGAYDAELLEGWARRFRALAHERRDAVVLDTSRSPEEVLGEAIDRIWERYVARWAAQ